MGWKFQRDGFNFKKNIILTEKITAMKHSIIRSSQCSAFKHALALRMSYWNLRDEFYMQTTKWWLYRILRKIYMFLKFLSNHQFIWMNVKKNWKRYKHKINNTKQKRGCPRGVMVKAMDCGIIVSQFVLQLHYYIHFRANTLGKGMNPLILPAMG